MTPDAEPTATTAEPDPATEGFQKQRDAEEKRADFERRRAIQAQLAAETRRRRSAGLFSLRNPFGNLSGLLGAG